MTTRDHAELARRRTDEASGGDVNYYLVEIAHPRLGVPYVAEVEDIIEALDMRFCEGNVFKAMVRSAKLRQDLGKPGSSKRYEAQKGVYYAKRIVALAQRRERLRGAGLYDLLDLDLVVHVEEPKRLSPYKVDVEEFIAALDPTDAEAMTLRAVMTLCVMRRDIDAAGRELEEAHKCLAAASLVMDEVE